MNDSTNTNDTPPNGTPPNGRGETRGDEQSRSDDETSPDARQSDASQSDATTAAPNGVDAASDSGGSDASATEASADAVDDSSARDHALQDAAEAIIFAADEPVPPHRIAEIVAEVTGREQPSIDAVESAVDDLNAAYRETGRVLEIHRWAGGYRMTTRSTLSPFVKALFVGEQETSLSRSLMETLAVLAYRQPVTRPEVDFIRGVNSDYAIRKLLELGLADVKGRAESLGRPLLYGTTPRFLEQFGLNTLEDLPTLKEVRDLLDDPAFDEERAMLLQLDTEEAAAVRKAAEGDLAKVVKTLDAPHDVPEELHDDANDAHDADEPEASGEDGE